MDALDPRHGTHKGLPAHMRAGTPVCEPCRIANRVYQRRQRKIRQLYGGRMVDATGSRRRIQALMRLGWSAVAIADRLGMNNNNLLNTINRPSGQIYGVTAKRIAAVYEELSMSLPPETTTSERISVSRTRGLARRRDWPPPLAWDDIDNPDERPTGWRYQPTDRAEAIRDMADMGLGVTEVSRRLHTSAEALQAWCMRKGISAVYRQLAARESLRANQWTRESA